MTLILFNINLSDYDIPQDLLKHPGIQNCIMLLLSKLKPLIVAVDFNS